MVIKIDFHEVLSTLNEMAETAAEVARDRSQDPRTRLAAATATAKILTPLIPATKTLREMEREDLRWASRVLERQGRNDLEADLEAIREAEAREIAERHVAKNSAPPTIEQKPDW